MAQRRPSLFIVPRTRRRRTSCPGLLEMLVAAYQRTVTPEDFLAYLYGILAQPAFTAHFAKELESRDLRVPITMDAALFERVRAVPAPIFSGCTPTASASCPKASRAAKSHPARPDAP